MTDFADIRPASAPPPTGASPGVLRWISINNPFYVLSAVLFLAGLWISFGPDTEETQTWPLMAGLAGYTLLLAVTACLLVRFGNVWDDVRTVLLLVVLMFLAMSLTFDMVLVLTPERGFACNVGGLLFAVAVSEGVLRGSRLLLPACYRVPYCLILALFFLYPLALSPLLDEPRSEVLMWGLFGFAAAAGLIFLTLLPAIRRGAEAVRGNGSPWSWPLYPWALFGLLALAVPARAYLLCWSMAPLDGGGRLIFGTYFLVPFGLAIAALVLESGIASGRRGVAWAALTVPVGLAVLALTGHGDDSIYRGFLEMFSARLGGDPRYLTLLAAAGFYAYAGLRRVSLAAEALTAVLAALAVVGPDTLKAGELVSPQPIPILAAALLQLALGLRGCISWRCAAGFSGLVAVASLVLPEITSDPVLDVLIVFHLALLAVMTVGAAFEDALARLLRFVGAAVVLLASLAALFGDFSFFDGLPPAVIAAYPPVMAALLAAYGWLLGHRPSLAAAALIQAKWLALIAWNGYRSLRQTVPGLDHILLSLLLFALAVVVSLAKSGHLSQWIASRRRIRRRAS